MNENHPDSLSPLEQFRRLDVRDRLKVALGGLGIRTSADIFDAAQKEYEELGELVGRLDKRNQENVARAGLRIRTSRDVFEAIQKECEQARVDAAAEGKRKYTGKIEQARAKRPRTMDRREISNDEQIEEEVASVLRSLEEEFAEKERLSDGQAWCRPISLATKVATVQEFYKAFHDRNTLPIYTCRICYVKFGRSELQEVGWDVWMASRIEKKKNSPFKCSSCFPVGKRILVCADCVKHLRRGALSSAAQLHV